MHLKKLNKLRSKQHPLVIKYKSKDVDEQVIYNLTPEKSQFASKIRAMCNSFRYNTNKIIKKHKYEIIQINRILKSLSNDKSIQITRPDKGKIIVIMDKDNYNKKMFEILNDNGTFKPLDVDETLADKDRLIRKSKQLKNNGCITEKEYYYCRPTSSQSARIYGLPKIHKTHAPLRPIVAASGAFNYKLAKLLTK